LSEGKKIAIIEKSNNKKLLAEVMNINRKNIYHKGTKLKKDLAVKTAIEQTFKIHPAYGHRRLAMALGVNRKKILRVMHTFNLTPPRLWYQKRFTTRSNQAYQTKYSNLLKKKDLTGCLIGEVWSSDLTYIKFQGRFLYLTIIQDIVSKEVVGFNLSDRHDAALVLKTLQEAVLRTIRFPKVFHSNRGREYLAENCIRFLEKAGVTISVSDPGSPWQNGWSESFFSRFKTESGDLTRFSSVGELVEYVFFYMRYYNHDRIQLKIKMSPVQFKQRFLESGLEKWGT